MRGALELSLGEDFANGRLPTFTRLLPKPHDAAPLRDAGIDVCQQVQVLGRLLARHRRGARDFTKQGFGGHAGAAAG